MIYKSYLLLISLIVGPVCYNVSYAQNRLVLTPGVMYFDYEETGDDGSFLDGETGPVPGVNAAVEIQYYPKFTGIVFGGYYSGTVDYDGHTQAGLPIQTKTKEDFFTLGVAAQFPVGNRQSELLLQTGYAFKRWERDIQSIGNVSGLFEIYAWQELSFGALVTIEAENNSRLNLYWGIFKTRNADIEINLSSDGYGRPVLPLGSSVGLELAAQWMSTKEVNNNVGFKLSYRNWKFGRSPDKTISGNSGNATVFEPMSETSNILFELVYFVPY